MRGRLPLPLLALVQVLAIAATAAASSSAAVSLNGPGKPPGTAPGTTTRAPPTSATTTTTTTTTGVPTSTARTTVASTTRPITSTVITTTATGPTTPGTSSAIAVISAAAVGPRPTTITANLAGPTTNSADQSPTASATKSAASAAPTPTAPASAATATATRGGGGPPRAAAASARTAAAAPGPSIHVVSGPLIDDEDPPIPQPMPAADEDLPLIPSWSNKGANVPEADENMDVRSNNPRGGRAPPSDPNSLYQEAATPTTLDDEAQAQAHPSWHLVNSRRCGLSKNPFSDRIVGGAMAALGQYPWLARMGYNLDDMPRRVYRCAGAVITHLHVITAAHCVKNLPQNFEFVGVRLGEWDTTTDPDCQNSVCAPAVYDVDPESVIVHQDYNNPRFANDIALVKLAQKINFNGWVAPVCIPYGDLLSKSFESERTEVAGWGIYDITLQKSSQELRTVHLPVVSNSICHALYRNQANITKKQMCAGGELGSDACSGDSGGPLLKVEAYSGGPRYYIVGIVSFGSRRCGLTPAPGVYTRVSYYTDWILDNIEQT